MTTPRATYRLQLTPELNFDRAGQILPYLADLGVSHVYCSPILQAARGSLHGYDVVDPTKISADLGGREGFERFAQKARDHGLGLIVDIVPNHMATAGRRNPWWWDLLLNGKQSRYADYFDVEWQPTTSSVRDKILLGVLGDRYGRELEGGELKFERSGDEMLLRYHDDVFPVAPASIQGLDIDAIQNDPAAFDAVLQQQHYRLAYWRTAQEELNYRRFFTIDSLIGLRVENAQVFDDSHRLILELVADKLIAGLRIDHIDGLRDPAAYIARLRSAAPEAYIVVEKILGRDEELRPFEVQGTTGYEFIAHAQNLFVDSAGEPAMTALYHAFTGETQPYVEVARVSRLEVMSTDLLPDLERLTNRLLEICDSDFRHRDRVRREVRDAVREVAAAFGVYRTYVRPGEPAADADRRQVEAAIEEATRRRPDIDPELLALVRDVLVADRRGDIEAAFCARFQQFTPAVMAKGVEDTAFYRYHRLISLNEVGSDPATFGRPTEAFHEWCAKAAKRPDSMLTLSTHDTKRSADIRARLDLLSEIPAEWEHAVRRWAEHNEQYRAHGYPDRNLEYLIYQTLVGAWPLNVERLKQFLQKAAREARTHTSWTNPVPAYEDAVAQFATSIMSDSEFLTDLETFIGRNQLVARGRLVSLAQTVLLLTAPGVPDIYQGTELWSFVLVDPDNRAPVDFEARTRALREMSRDDKLWAIARLLQERARHPEVFSALDYTGLAASGAKARHVVAFVRGPLLVVVPRLVAGLNGDWGDTALALPPGSWTNLFTGATFSGTCSMSELTAEYPVAVFRRA